METYIADIHFSKFPIKADGVARTKMRAKNIDNLRLKLIATCESRPKDTSISRIEVYKERKSGSASYLGELFCNDWYYWYDSPDDKFGRRVSEKTGKLKRRY